MKVLLGCLALLPVIASHVYLQLPPLNVNSPSTGHQIPLGLHQYNQQDHEISLKDPQSREDSSSLRDSEQLTESQRLGDYDFAVRIPEGFFAQAKRSGDPSLPSGYLIPSFHHHPLPLRPLGYARFAHNLSQQRSSYNTPLTSNQLHLEGFHQDGAKRTPSKRYLGIELPDYIASNYGADKTSNMKLHNLKQRMRSVGK